MRDSRRRLVSSSLAVVTAVAVTGGAAWALAANDSAPADASATAAAGTAETVEVLQPLANEHQELLPHIEALRTTADSVGEISDSELQAKVAESREFLVDGLIPHATVEDQVLYKEVNRLIGKGGDHTSATATMSEDHHGVHLLTEELVALEGQLADGLDDQEAKDLRRVLYSLNGLVGLHFEKEEAVYIPELEKRLSPAQAQRLLDDMDHAAEELGGEHAH